MKYGLIEAWIRSSKESEDTSIVIMNNGFQMKGALESITGEVLVIREKDTGNISLVNMANVSTIKSENGKTKL